MYLAHRTEDGRTQSIFEHADNVAARCAAFAAAFGAEAFGKEIGMAHDIGKYSDAFQLRISGQNIRADHATAGAQEIAKYLGWPAAYCVAGHHGGLPDGGGKGDDAFAPTLSGRLKRPVESYEAFAKDITLARVRFQPPKLLGRGGFTMAFWIRMLFSCLVDADYLDTETFMLGEAAPRGSTVTMDALLTRLESYIAPWRNAASELNRARCDILRACLEAGASEAPGLFTLTVPTGGGKTVSSLAFALHHAVTQKKKRIVYVIPYTGIIEQTADIFRTVLGAENVLEHHANVDFGDDENAPLDPEKARKKLAAENWDLPVVVTTAVQFFESLFANRPSRCRKLHNLAESVMIFDEAQTIPLPYLLPCVRGIAELTVNYGATCVLCTATQPALGPLFASLAPELAPRELAPRLSTGVFRRVCYETLDPLSAEALAARLNRESQVLCITSTRRAAQTVYHLLDAEGSYHLSTLMTPAHRREVLQTVKARLLAGLPCRVVSTSLIEAGVDVDFPTVYREEAGLDSIVQAAGRCNREGKRPAESSRVYIFRFTENIRLPDSLRRPLEVMRTILADGMAPDAPETVERYFTVLRRFTGEGIDRLHLVERFEDGVQDPGHPSFPFAETADKFRLIEQNTRSVFIPHTPEAEALAVKLRQGAPGRALLRKAGQFSVTIYEDHFQALYNCNALEFPTDGLAVLTDLSLYNTSTGLTKPNDVGAGIFL